MTDRPHDPADSERVATSGRESTNGRERASERENTNANRAERAMRGTNHRSDHARAFVGHIAVDPPADDGRTSVSTDANEQSPDDDRPASTPAETIETVGTETGSLDRPPAPVAETVVGSPRDLVGLWTAIGCYLDELAARGESHGARATICFDSLTELRRSVTPDRAIRFVRLLVGRFRRANVAAHVHCDRAACPPGFLAEIRPLFDATIPDRFDSPRRSGVRAALRDALSIPERRGVLRHLVATGGEATIRELTARIVAAEGVTDSLDATRAALSDEHLPALAETGLITVRPQDERVTLTASAMRLPWLADRGTDRHDSE